MNAASDVEPGLRIYCSSIQSVPWRREASSSIVEVKTLTSTSQSLPNLRHSADDEDTRQISGSPGTQRSDPEHKYLHSRSARRLTRLLSKVDSTESTIDLDLCRKSLTDIPFNTISNDDCVTLRLQGNFISQLSPEVTRLGQLKVLRLDNNLLTALPKEIGHLTNLRQLSIMGNRIRALPETMAKLIYLEILDISHNQIATLGETIGQLRQLRILNAEDNCIDHIMETAFEDCHWHRPLERLEELYLGINALNDLPSSLFKLGNLRILDVHSNRLEPMTPYPFAQLTNLVHLDLWSNPQLEMQWQELQTLSLLQKLNLGKTRTNEPAGLAHLAHLSELRLTYLAMSTVPAALGDYLPCIRTLDLSFNKLTEIPTAVCALHHLERLNLDNNMIHRITDSVASLRTLQVLSLSGNCLEFLPGTLFQLSQLRELHIANNCLMVIPEEINRLTNLRALDVSGNPELRMLPVSVCDLEELSTVNINSFSFPEGENGSNGTEVQPSLEDGFRVFFGRKGLFPRVASATKSPPTLYNLCKVKVHDSLLHIDEADSQSTDNNTNFALHDIPIAVAVDILSAKACLHCKKCLHAENCHQFVTTAHTMLSRRRHEERQAYPWFYYIYVESHACSNSCAKALSPISAIYCRLQTD
eukprot:Clim_evm3s246 gene=Clim_evmTU3s246